MCACKKGHREVVALLVRQQAVELDTTNKNGLAPEEVTGDREIRRLLREEHWRRARLEVGPRGGLTPSRWGSRPRDWSSRRGGKWR
jgi:hypothetical protein